MSQQSVDAGVHIPAGLSAASYPDAAIDDGNDELPPGLDIGAADEKPAQPSAKTPAAVSPTPAPVAQAPAPVPAASKPAAATSAPLSPSAGASFSKSDRDYVEGAYDFARAAAATARLTEKAVTEMRPKLLKLIEESKAGNTNIAELETRLKAAIDAAAHTASEGVAGGKAADEHAGKVEADLATVRGTVQSHADTLFGAASSTATAASEGAAATATSTHAPEGLVARTGALEARATQAATAHDELAARLTSESASLTAAIGAAKTDMEARIASEKSELLSTIAAADEKLSTRIAAAETTAASDKSEVSARIAAAEEKEAKDIADALSTVSLTASALDGKFTRSVEETRAALTEANEALAKKLAQETHDRTEAVSDVNKALAANAEKQKEYTDAASAQAAEERAKVREELCAAYGKFTARCDAADKTAADNKAELTTALTTGIADLTAKFTGITDADRQAASDAAAALNVRVDTESAARTEGDKALDAALTEVRAQLAAETHARSTAVSELDAKTTAATGELRTHVLESDEALAKKLAQETHDRTEAVSELTKALEASAKSEREYADAHFHKAAEERNEIRGALAAADSKLTSRIAAAEQTSAAAVDAAQKEATAALAQTRALFKEEVDTISGHVATEIESRKAGVKGAMDANAALRSENDAAHGKMEQRIVALETGLQDETATRTSGDATLAGHLSAEVAARDAAIHDLKAQLEAANKVIAQLSSRVEVVEGTKASVDHAIQTVKDAHGKWQHEMAEAKKTFTTGLADANTAINEASTRLQRNTEAFRERILKEAADQAAAVNKALDTTNRNVADLAKVVDGNKKEAETGIQQAKQAAVDEAAKALGTARAELAAESAKLAGSVSATAAQAAKELSTAIGDVNKTTGELNTHLQGVEMKANNEYVNIRKEGADALEKATAQLDARVTSEKEALTAKINGDVGAARADLTSTFGSRCKKLEDDVTDLMAGGVKQAEGLRHEIKAESAIMRAENLKQQAELRSDLTTSVQTNVTAAKSDLMTTINSANAKLVDAVTDLGNFKSTVASTYATQATLAASYFTKSEVDTKIATVASDSASTLQQAKQIFAEQQITNQSVGSKLENLTKADDALRIHSSVLSTRFDSLRAEIAENRTRVQHIENLGFHSDAMKYKPDLWPAAIEGLLVTSNDLKEKLKTEQAEKAALKKQVEELEKEMASIRGVFRVLQTFIPDAKDIPIKGASSAIGVAGSSVSDPTNPVGGAGR